MEFTELKDRRRTAYAHLDALRVSMKAFCIERNIDSPNIDDLSVTDLLKFTNLVIRLSQRLAVRPADSGDPAC